MLIWTPARSFRDSGQREVAFCELVAYPAGVMKQFTLLLAVIGLGLCSCERHEWESDPAKSSDTINLFKHEDHSGDHKEEVKPEAEKVKEEGV